MTIRATLCHVRDGQRVLLLKKSRGLFGGGKWNAPGGKFKPKEDPKECAIREVLEETGLKVKSPKKHGVLTFYFGEKEEPDWIVHIFSADSFTGELKSSEEGALKWFDQDEIPYDEMWGDDRHWIPLLLEGKLFEGAFHFDEGGKKLMDHSIEVTS